MEQAAIQRRLLELGVTLRTAEALMAWDGGAAEVACAYTGRRSRRAAPALVLVTARLPNEALTLALAQRRAAWPDAGLASVTAIGDALAPGTIAMATYAGRRYSEELDAPPRADDRPDFRREIAELLPLA
jgi:dimethylamine/trimethylamine dehydrogenase